MKERILLSTIILVLWGCGAQNSPREEDNLATPSGRVTDESQNILPIKISINYPLTIKEDNSTLLYKDIIDIEKNTQQLKEAHKKLELLMADIIEECQNKNPCYLPKYKITFQHYIETAPYQYKIILENIIFKWKEDNSEIVSIYKDNSSILTLHYAEDSEKEALYINNQNLNKNISMVILKKESLYQLNVIHTENKKRDFLEHITLENSIKIEDKENIFPIYALKEELKDGDYLLIEKGTKELSFIDTIEASEGMISIVNGEFQGFLYTLDSNERLDEMKSVLLKK